MHAIRRDRAGQCKACYSYDSKSKIQFGQEAFHDLSGYRLQGADALKRVKLADLCEPEDMALLKLQWGSLTRGQPATFPMRFCCMGKTEANWVQLACVPVFDASSAVVSITGCVTDLNAQKKVEHEAIKRAEALERLHLSEARLLKFIENAPLGIAIFDQNARLSFVNATWIELTGHPRVPTEEVDIRSVIFSDDLSSFEDCLEEIVQKGKTANRHFRLKRLWDSEATSVPDQTWVSFTAFREDVDGGGCQITTTMTDISNFKFAESIQRARLEEAVEARRQQEK